MKAVSDDRTMERLEKLKAERNALVLAHNYQIPQIQDAADYVGDSLELSRQSAASDAEVIVFCGVDFMAETAKILAPEKTVLHPAPGAGCPLAQMIDVSDLRQAKEAHPDAAVVCYVNSSAAVKAESDVCCTSSNAVDVVNALEEDEVLFVPDKNLADWVSKQTSKRIIPWSGYCTPHNGVRPEEVTRAKELHPDAVVMVHPECRPEVVAMADVVTSTSGMLRYAAKSESREFIVGTEMGLLHGLQKQNPDKRFYLLSPALVCPNMKQIATLEMIVDCLERNEPQVDVPEPVRKRAYAAVERMLSIG